MIPECAGRRSRVFALSDCSSVRLPNGQEVSVKTDFEGRAWKGPRAYFKRAEEDPLSLHHQVGHLLPEITELPPEELIPDPEMVKIDEQRGQFRQEISNMMLSAYKTTPPIFYPREEVLHLIENIVEDLFSLLTISTDISNDLPTIFHSLRHSIDLQADDYRLTTAEELKVKAGITTLENSAKIHKTIVKLFSEKEDFGLTPVLLQIIRRTYLNNHSDLPLREEIEELFDELLNYFLEVLNSPILSYKWPGNPSSKKFRLAEDLDWIRSKVLNQLENEASKYKLTKEEREQLRAAFITAFYNKPVLNLIEEALL